MTWRKRSPDTHTKKKAAIEVSDDDFLDPLPLPYAASSSTSINTVKPKTKEKTRAVYNQSNVDFVDTPLSRPGTSSSSTSTAMTKAPMQNLQQYDIEQKRPLYNGGYNVLHGHQSSFTPQQITNMRLEVSLQYQMMGHARKRLLRLQELRGKAASLYQCHWKLTGGFLCTVEQQRDSRICCPFDAYWRKWPCKL